MVRGELVEIPREAPQLTKDAVPTLFPDAPKYLTKRAPLKRKERDLCNQKPIEHKKRKRQSSTEATDVLSTHVEDSTSDASVAFEFSDLEASPPWTKVNLENCEQQTFACCHTNGDGSLDSLLVSRRVVFDFRRAGVSCSSRRVVFEKKNIWARIHKTNLR